MFPHGHYNGIRTSEDIEQHVFNTFGNNKIYDLVQKGSQGWFFNKDVAKIHFTMLRLQKTWWILFLSLQ